MTEIFICRKGSLTQPSKLALRAAGIIVAEVDDPDNCKFIRATETVSGSDMLYAAMKALNTNWNDDTYRIAQRNRGAFSQELGKLIEASRSKP